MQRRLVLKSKPEQAGYAGPASLRQMAVAKLDRLCEGLGCGRLRDEAVGVLDEMCEGWSELSALAAPYWPSDITDDGSPVEFSVAFSGGRMELRLLAEPQRMPASIASNWQAGLDLNRRLAVEHGAYLGRFERIREIFEPVLSESPRFALWHAAAIDSSGAKTFKAYLNPAIRGRSAATVVVREALAALGMTEAWDFLAAELGPMGQFVYFALDLSPARTARVKVYAAYDADRVEELDAALSRAKLCPPGQLAEWANVLTGGRAPLDERGLQVCYSFQSGKSVPSLTLYVPVRTFCENDAEALERGRHFLGTTEAETLSRAVRHMAGRPLEMGRGLITYFALRSDATGPRLTVYLSPEIYTVASARPMSERAPGMLAHSGIRDLRPRATPLRRPSFADVLARIEERRLALAEHPFIVTLSSASGTLDDIRFISAQVAFFVLCFQDVLRLVHDHTTDPFLKEIARTQELEDKGHDRWYLQDLERMGVSVGLRELFSSETAAIRDVAYTQVSDVLKASSDCARLGVVLSLEAAGAEFFESMIGFVERQSRLRGLLYFGRRHQRVEQNHEILADDAQRRLAAMEMDGPTFSEVLAVVDRTFETMVRLADHLLRELNGARRTSLPVPAERAG